MSQCGKTHEVSGIIGLSGRTIGTMVLSFSEQLALKAAGAMQLVEADSINDDVLDSVAEIAWLVATAAKADLTEFELTLSVPTVVTGRNRRVRFPSNVTPLAVPCQTMWGPLSLEIGLAPASLVTSRGRIEIAAKSAYDGIKSSSSRPGLVDMVPARTRFSAFIACGPMNRPCPP